MKKTSKNLINDKSYSLSSYCKFIKNIWESYRQHEQQLLLNYDNHIYYLDLFIDDKKIFREYKDNLNDQTLLTVARSHLTGVVALSKA